MAMAISTATTTARTRKPPLRYSHGVNSPTKTKNHTTVRSATMPVPVISAFAPGVRSAFSRPGRHAVARAAPMSSPMACESVPKYARLGSAYSGNPFCTDSSDHPGGREHGEDECRDAHAAAAGPSHDQEGDGGPHQVELLLDRERPQVLEQRRPPDELEVGRVVEDVPPVVDVEDRRDRVGAHLGRRVAEEEGGRDGDHGEQQDERRQQAPRAAEVELREVDAARPVELLEDAAR